MQEPGRRPFAGVDLRRPKGYPAAPSTATPVAPVDEAGAGDPCPRCESRDTKFCYYNNYNTSQPRHYCRSCRRYWTKGGSLRNVPVGGGSRKSASSSAASSSSSSASSASPKRAKNSKRQRVAPPEPEPEPGAADDVSAGAAEKETTIDGTIGCPTTARGTASGPVDDPATAVDTARATASGTAVDAAGTEVTEATANGTVDDPTTPLDEARTEASADPSVALGLRVAEEPFEWPSGCDLGSYWTPGVLADMDPVLFPDLLP